MRSVQVKAFSETGSTLQIRLDKLDGRVIAQVKIPQCDTWITVNSKLKKFKFGIYDLFIIQKSNTPVEVDWICYK